ncbi:MAG: hypothetical protein M3373_12215 [Gemmatimonadota bacterium]|nr:hypothetical protein [Gemmatimonadota bacterium]
MSISVRSPARLTPLLAAAVVLVASLVLAPAGFAHAATPDIIVGEGSLVYDERGERPGASRVRNSTGERTDKSRPRDDTGLVPRENCAAKPAARPSRALDGLATSRSPVRQSPGR